jgi:hypothetical protein
MPTLLALALLAAPPAQANSTGRTGRSTTGCTSCHGSSADTTTTASFSASATEVAPGDTVQVTFTVSTTSSSRTAAGLNVSASSGSFTAGTGTKVSSGELTHSTPGAMSGSTVSFVFDWTAPSTTGTVTLSGVGNAVNENGSTSGDGWNLATDLELDVVCSDDDGDGFTDCAGDCDDTDGSIFPGATETCDGVDEDCDGTIDNSPSDGTTFYADSDSDGYGDSGSTTVACSVPTGFVADDTDCDDSDSAVNPGATEVCDSAATDEDCDGLADDADPSVTGTSTFYEDADSDGYGDASSTAAACAAPSGFVSDNTDCDDDNSAVNPGATEVCDAADVDEDCDGLADDADSSVTGTSTFYEDDDADGYGSTTTAGLCDLASGYAEVGGDCDDTDADVNPDGVETCDGVDEDCNGLIDDSATDTDTFYADLDADGYGDPDDTVESCSAPTGYVDDDQDCDDDDAAVNPAATEVCDAAATDENCDGLADDADPSVTGTTDWYADTDSDGYGDAFLAAACVAPSTGVALDGDCDDTDAATYPGAPEDCTEDVDRNCDGVSGLVDSDDDGWAACEECDDTDAAVNPDAAEVCNGVDDDCDEVVDGPDAVDAVEYFVDEDGDGYGDPEATERACEEGDGLVADDTDCDDGDAAVNPGEAELWYDGVDQDCDENDDDQDEDGVALEDDCDDEDPEQSAPEDCAGDEGGDEGTGDDGSGDDGSGDDGTGDDGTGDDGSGDDEGDKSGCATAGGGGLGGLLAGLLLVGGRRREH